MKTEQIIEEREDSVKMKMRFKRFLSGFMAVATLASVIIQPVAVSASELEPEEIPIEHVFVGYRQDGDVAEDYQGNLYLILCDPGIHPIGSVCMEQSELDDAVKLGKREDYTGELLEEIPE